MHCDPLPRDFVADGCSVNCPWCKADVGGATVSLNALFDAHAEDALKYPTRGAGDCADEGMLTADCPACSRPFMISLKANGIVRLLAVRTEADAKLMFGAAA